MKTLMKNVTATETEPINGNMSIQKCQIQSKYHMESNLAIKLIQLHKK